MPARRKKKKPTKKVLIILGLLVAFVLAFLWFAFRTKIWSNSRRTVIASEGENGGVTLTIFDPLDTSITQVQIPGSLQINLAHQLGIWRLRSVWQLGDNEDLDGQLVADSLSKSLALPVDAWSDGVNTNLSLGDKVRIALFSLSVKPIDKTYLNLEETGYLKSETLSDGEPGFVVKKPVPSIIVTRFSIKTIVEEGKLVSLKKKGGSGERIKEVSDLISVLGSKVVSVEEAFDFDGDCEIITNGQSVTAKELSRLLRCESKSSEDLDTNQVVLILGERFFFRF